MEYIDNLGQSLDRIPPTKIVNHVKTNLTDDPRRKKLITKRGTKYPERITDIEKAATLMFAAVGDETLLSRHIVYKATNVYDSWTFGGPKMQDIIAVNLYRSI